MKLTVWSLLSGGSSGHAVIVVSQSCTAGTVLDLYCKEKGIPVNGSYVLKSYSGAQLNPQKALSEQGVTDRDILSVTLAENDSHLFAFGSWWLVALISSFIGVFLVVYSLYMLITLVFIPLKQYGVVVDAGSTHSELYVFTWTTDSSQETADVSLLHRCFTHGGIASYATHPDDLSSYLQDCLDEAEGHVPLPSRATSPLFLAATGGMRIIRDFDPKGATAVLAELRKLLSSSSFNVHPGNVFIATGREEGSSGWIAINYLLGTLDQDTLTAAVLDVGGASVQLSQELHPMHSGWPTINITLFNITRKLYSRTFLCYGTNEAYYRYSFFMSSKNGYRDLKSKEFHDPCLPRGMERMFSGNEFSFSCTLTKKWNYTAYSPYKEVTIPDKYRLKYKSKPVLNDLSKNNDSGEISGKNFRRFTGMSQPRLCEEKVQMLFNLKLCSKTFAYGSCLYKTEVPTFSRNLIAFSDVFAYLWPLFGVTSETSLVQLHRAIYRICEMDIVQLKKKHPDLNQILLQDLCFDGMYIYKLITEGLGVTADSWQRVHFTNKVKHQKVEWPLGFMVNKTETFTLEKTQSTWELLPVILLILLATGFIITAVIFLRHSFKIHHSTSYQRILTEHLDHQMYGKV